MLTQDKNVAKTEQIDLISVVKEYLRHWKLFLVLISLSVFIAAIVYLVSSNQYSVASSVILKENDGPTGGGSLIGLEELGLISTTNNIDNEVAVFKSPDLMAEVIKSLEIQTSYWEHNGLKKVELYKESPFSVTLEGLVLEPSEKIRLDVEFGNEGVQVKGVYVYLDGESDFSTKLDALPGYIDLPNKGGRLFISKNKNTKEALSSVFEVKIRSVEDVAVELMRALSISAETKRASVLNMNVAVGNMVKGVDILTELVKKYNEDNDKDKNQTAFSTSVFINERLQDIEVELGGVEKGVETYKQEQGITNLSAETQLYMEQTGVNEQKKIEIETQLGVIQMVETYINKSENLRKPIPNIGIIDPALVEAITLYNTKLLEFEQMSSSIGDENPLKKQLKEELSQMHTNIKESVISVKTAMFLSKKNLDVQNALISSRIHSLPQQERGLLEKMRQQQIKENLYLFLLQKREETNITMAATSDKAKMIIKPRMKEKVAPNLMKIFLISLSMGILIGVVFVYLKRLFRVTISDRKELEELSNVAVIGQISKNETEDNIVVKKGDTSSLVELFRNLRNNIGFVLGRRENTVIMITSTIAQEGKSFIGSNLAMSFALNSKKVLIVGLDIRNPQLAKNFGVPVSKGVTSYLNGDVEDWHELVHSYPMHPNLEILQGGIIHPNPNELLMSPALSKLIEEAREEYDIVILDTAPVGIISDTFLISQYSDLTLYIVREKYTHRDSVSFINEQSENKRLPNMYLVYNDVDLKNENYRYGYGKAYGYGQK